MVWAPVQGDPLSAPIGVVFIYYTSTISKYTGITLLASTHGVLTFLTDNKPAKNIIMVFPRLDIDFKEQLYIVKKITVYNCRTIVFICPEFSDILCIRKHVF